MKKPILIVLILVIAGLGIYFWKNQTSSVMTKDCGTDAACFAASFRSCTPSKIYGGLQEVISGTPESCKVKFLTADPESTDAPQVSTECSVENTASYQDGEINVVYVIDKGSKCSGAYYDWYINLVNQSSITN